MARVHNFSAGPATMPVEVLERAATELVDFRGAGFSLLEASHRGKEYAAVHRAAVDGIRDLLAIPSTHDVMLLAGGATMQFGMVPLNLLPAGSTAAYTVTGSWAKKARADAEKVGAVRVAWDGSSSSFTTLPDAATVTTEPTDAYLHITSNETIQGVQWPAFPAVDAPVVADMSSDFLSRPLEVDRFGLIYAGAQKNIGPAGVTVVIARRELTDRAPDTLPAYLDYRTHRDADSLYNTPPVFAIYFVALVVEWIARQGGLAAMATINESKASMLYDAIESSDGFYRCPVDPRVRSRMNVVFRLPSEELEARFIQEAGARGLVGLKGHRSVGGVRASIYNAMPAAGVEALVAFMREFRR